QAISAVPSPSPVAPPAQTGAVATPSLGPVSIATTTPSARSTQLPTFPRLGIPLAFGATLAAVIAVVLLFWRFSQRHPSTSTRQTSNTPASTSHLWDGANPTLKHLAQL